jgi:hypothetical protein
MSSQDAFFNINLDTLLEGIDLEKVKAISELNKLDITQTLMLLINNSIDGVYKIVHPKIALECKETKEKERSKEKENKEKYIIININKEKLENTLLSNISMSKVSEKLTAPKSGKLATLKTEIGKKMASGARKTPNKKMPSDWVHFRDQDELRDDKILKAADAKGYDFYSTKKLFFDFVDYNLSKGKVYANWYRAWGRWMSNDIKWNGPPKRQHSDDSVLKSYKTLTPGGGF